MLDVVSLVGACSSVIIMMVYNPAAVLCMTSQPADPQATKALLVNEAVRVLFRAKSLA